MSEEWGPWIEHDGLGLPTCVMIGVWMQCEVLGQRGRRMKEGRVHEGTVNSPSWFEKTPYGRFEMVVRYRIRKPRALREMIEMVESLPAPSQPVEQSVEVVS
ncbi:MAG: hypothetical protein EP336_09405 [Rhodobacteraceae bacterium]|nr:MAG: hypothetical protein EP336_09405 [Paracoccaceae bacterium]